MSQPVDLQVVEFGLGTEVFAVPVKLVREILDYTPPAHVPGFAVIIDVARIFTTGDTAMAGDGSHPHLVDG